MTFFVILAILLTLIVGILYKYKVFAFIQYAKQEPTNFPSMPPIAPQTPPHTPSRAETIYTTAKSLIGEHLTLNSNIPPDLGCAEAISYVLKQAGIVGLPQTGIAGTAALFTWLKANFQAVAQPLAGDIIISPTGTSTLGTSHGHVGCVAMYGILSNDSNTGLFKENYTLGSWDDLFHRELGFPIYYFRAVGQ